MLDIKFIRENPDKTKEACRNKNVAEGDRLVEQALEFDVKRRSLLVSLENLRAKQNKFTRDNIEEARKNKLEIKALEPEVAETESKLKEVLSQIPNIPFEDVPIGSSEQENQVVKTVGKKPTFAFTPKSHWQLGEELELIDKERAAKVTGARFAYLKGPLVLLHLALMRFGLDVLTNEKTLASIAKSAKLKISTKPFIPVMPPFMLRTEPYQAMDRLEPREERYKIEGEDLWLQGSAEHVLGTMHMHEALEEKEFPVRYVGYATSFRREAGSYGRDTEGITRMHQFDKLEMESLTTAENSLAEHYFMVAIQEYLMKQLGLPYEVVLKCTADIGKPNARGVDINVWLPAQNKYRETHSADHMTDYQARRLQTRVRRASGNMELVHTNDATVFSQRPLIAILENFQQKDSSIKIPRALQKYAGFSKIPGNVKPKK